MSPRRIALGFGLLTAGVILVLAIVFPSPYDESLYRNFAEAFVRIGRPFLPEWPNGYFLLFHPYLPVLINAAAISLGGEALLVLRIVHWVVWVLPTLWLTWRLARDLSGNEASGAWAMAFLAAVPFFQAEAATTEFDLPYTAMMLAGVWLTWRWHRELSTGRIFGRTWGALAALLVLCAWVKFQCALVVFSSGLLTLARLPTLAKVVRGKAFLAVVTLFALSGFSFLTWVSWAGHLGGDFAPALAHLLRGLGGEVKAYQSEVSAYSWIHYLLFASAHIDIPLFLAGAIFLGRGVFRKETREPTLYLLVPASLVVAALLASGIREVRYLDPALPLLCIAIGMGLGRSVDPRKAMARRLAAAFGATAALLGLLNQFGHRLPSLSLAGFQVEPVKLGALLLAGAALVAWIRGRSASLSGVVILVATFVAGEHHYWHTFSSLEPGWRETDETARQLRPICQDHTTFGLARMSLAYGLACPFVNLQYRKPTETAPLPPIDVWVLEKGCEPPSVENFRKRAMTSSVESFEVWERR